MALVASPNSSFRDFQCEEDSIHVFLRMWDGRSLCCKVGRNESAVEKLERLNQKIMQEYPVYKSNYFMEMQGKPLSVHNGDCFLWRDNADVFVQYRNNGGCFMVIVGEG